MGIAVMILGESGSGKSASMRNFKNGDIGIIQATKKTLPFRSDLKPVVCDDYKLITNALIGSKAKSLVIDDAQYLMANEFMRMAKVTGFQKFTDIALNFWNLIHTVTDSLPDDKIVYFMAHTERDSEGHEKMKTIGKMLDEKITIEGMFTVVLKTSVRDHKYQFATQTNGQDTVKSPIGLFDTELIDNDLKAVDAAIRGYYELTGGKE